MSKSCNHCGNEIKWPEPYYKGALPLNPDGSEHRCKGKAKSTDEGFQSRDAPQKQKTISLMSESELARKDLLHDIPNIEEPQRSPKNIQIDELTVKFITKQNLLLDAIEKQVTTHLQKISYGRPVNGERIGLRTKLIWDAINKK